MIGQYVARSITKSHFLPVDTGTITIYSPLDTNVQWNVSIYLKIIRNSFDSKIFLQIMTKKQRRQKTRANFDLTPDFLIEIY